MEVHTILEPDILACGQKNAFTSHGVENLGQVPWASGVGALCLSLALVPSLALALAHGPGAHVQDLGPWKTKDNPLAGAEQEALELTRNASVPVHGNGKKRTSNTYDDRTGHTAVVAAQHRMGCNGMG